MGTNFYLMSKSKKLMRENFAVEKDYGITDNDKYNLEINMLWNMIGIFLV